jgi:P4 family phage/plasmid primase-like protien
MTDVLNIEFPLFVKEKQLKEDVMHFLATKENWKATEVLAQGLKEVFNFKSIRNDNEEEIWVYVDGIYLPNGKTYILENVRKIVGTLYTTYFANQVVSKIYTDTFIEKEDFFNQQNKFNEIIPVQNGLLNLRNNNLHEFTPNFYFFTKINAKYDQEKNCPKIKQFVKSITRNDLDYQTIQEIFGFSLLREYKFEKGFMFYGEHGRNGKSKILNLLKYFLGTENCASVSLQEIEKEQFSLINFHNKLVNISSDIPSTAVENTGIYKALTGRDLINANRKGKSHLQFVNYAKMIFACNELPLIKTLSNAFWIRWVLIDFPYRFLPQHEIDCIEDKTNVFLQNTEILKDLMSEDEMSGLLNWALEGLQRLNKTNKFSNETNSNMVKKYWLRKSNSVASFIEDCIELDYDSIMSKQEFRTHYHNYCVREQLNQMSDKAIKITLSNELGLSESYSKLEDVQVFCWKGIKFKTPLLSDNSFKIKNFIETKKEVTLKELTELVPEHLELIKILDVLESEGSIMEFRKGIWRKK